jgi:hypothetical protein
VFTKSGDVGRLHHIGSHHGKKFDQNEFIRSSELSFLKPNQNQKYNVERANPMHQLVHHSEVCQCAHLEFVDLIVDHVVHLRVETSWETLLGGELIDAWR